MVRISMSLCVNIISIGFIAKIAIDAMDALIALGYSSSQALSAIKKAYASNKDIGNTSELIKIALKNI